MSERERERERECVCVCMYTYKLHKSNATPVLSSRAHLGAHKRAAPFPSMLGGGGEGGWGGFPLPQTAQIHGRRRNCTRALGSFMGSHRGTLPEGIEGTLIGTSEGPRRIFLYPTRSRVLLPAIFPNHYPEQCFASKTGITQEPFSLPSVNSSGSNVLTNDGDPCANTSR